MSEERPNFSKLSCSVASKVDRIVMGHGGGGALTRSLVEEVFLPALDNELLGQRHDGAVFEVPKGRLATSTDGYVAKPMFFPGGDIGKLAVCGTVNDLAMCGARPLHLSAGFILEEGTTIEAVRRVARSVGETARAAGVSIATADTKVVERGAGDGVYIVTSGVGVCLGEGLVGPAAVRPGDAVILSGDVGRHGVAMLIARDELGLESEIASDCALVHEATMELFEAGLEIHALRDLTRGGLAAALVEIARDGGRNVSLRETAIAVDPAVRGACELLGLDPLHVANEGRFVVILPDDQAEEALAILRGHEVSGGAVIIGTIAAEPVGRVTLESAIGAARIVELPSGEQLPRIC